MKKCSIGGQGVLEGVMMRSTEQAALAVRKEDGSIVLSKWKLKQRPKGFLQWPIIRGCVNFVDMLKEGVKVIGDSAKLYDESLAQEESSKLEKKIAKKTGKNEMDVTIAVAVVISLALSIGLFFLLPSFLTKLFSKSIESTLLVNLIEGGIRIVILIGYMVFCCCIKDVKRVFMYHGAEHKTIACYEADEELTVENVRRHKRLHPRCGTSYLLIVMIMAILIYSVVGELFRVIGFVDINNNLFYRVLSRLILLPLIAGVAYEILKLCGKYENIFTKIIRWPGMQLQRLTTKEPDDSMMEIGILAFETALGEKTDEEIETLKNSFDRSVKPQSTEEQPEMFDFETPPVQAETESAQENEDEPS